jgi:RNA polymerase sigma-32 factor
MRVTDENGNSPIEAFFDNPEENPPDIETAKPLPRFSDDDPRPWWQRCGLFLAPAEERDLALRWRHQKDKAAGDRLVTAHLPLVAKRAAGFPSIKHDAAMAAGCVGLMLALEKFDQDFGSFRTYAWHFIGAQIRKAAVEQRSVVKGTRDGVSWSKDTLQKHPLLSWQKQRHTRLDKSLSGANDLRLPEDKTPEESFIEKEETATWRAALDVGLSALSERERQVFEARRLSDDPPTLQELALGLGISAERVRCIQAAAEAKVACASQHALTNRDLRRTARRLNPHNPHDDPVRLYRRCIDWNISPETARAIIHKKLNPKPFARRVGPMGTIEAAFHERWKAARKRLRAAETLKQQTVHSDKSERFTRSITRAEFSGRGQKASRSALRAWRAPTVMEIAA